MTVQELIEKLSWLSEEQKEAEVKFLDYEGHENPIDEIEQWRNNDNTITMVLIAS